MIAEIDGAAPYTHMETILTGGHIVAYLGILEGNTFHRAVDSEWRLPLDVAISEGLFEVCPTRTGEKRLLPIMLAKHGLRNGHHHSA